MKKIAFLFVLIFSLACSNTNNVKTYKSKGIIKGLDMGACICCGGYIIEIDKISYRLQKSFPPNFNLDFKNLPLKVKLDWELVPEGCANFITISAIEAIN